MRIFRQEGQTLVISVLFMTVLIGMAAVVLDVGSWYRADRAAQATADAAALAGAQALPTNPAQGIALATEYADKNGGSAGMTARLSSKWVANDTITVEVKRPAPGFFSKLFGVDGVTVGARAAARTGATGSARYVAPIVVNEQHPMLQNCKPGVCNDPTELNYYHLKPSGEPDGAGSFGFVNLDGSTNNPGSSTLGDWIVRGFDGYLDIGNYNSRTGNAFSSSNIGDVLRARIGTDLLFPVYRKLTASGSNAKYEIVGWVVFHLTGLDLQGNKEKLFGYFKEMIWHGIQVGGGTPGNGQAFFGVRSVELVE